MIRLIALCTLLAAHAAGAQDLTLPQGARALSERIQKLDSYDLPVGIYADGVIPTETLEGRVEKRTWRVGVGSKTTLQVFAPLRDQLVEEGYDILLECEAKSCGGFDFRFGTEVVPGPDMYVAIRDYRFLSARRGNDALSLLVSRDPPDAYLQIIRVMPEDAPQVSSQSVVPKEVVPEVEPQSAQLIEDGHLILSDLEFETGAAALGNGPFASLSELAQTLRDNPDMRIVLVGHTDNVGALDANVELSKRRAEAVKSRLVERYEIAAERLGAEGIGFLSPIAANTSTQGREANRRVEAVLLQN